MFLVVCLVIFKVYCADHTYTTMKMRVDTPASRIIRVAADKLGLRSDQPDDLKLCEVKSTGGLFPLVFALDFNLFSSERIIYKESDVSISCGLSLNGRLFLAPGDHLDALVSHTNSPMHGIIRVWLFIGAFARTRRSNAWYLAEIRDVWLERTCLCYNNVRLRAVHGD